MDRGTDAEKALLGQEVPLKLGYVGVKGRSIQNIKEGVTVKKGLEEEREFFASHPVYSTMQSGYIGTDALMQKLTKVLHCYIRADLPNIHKEILTKNNECEDRLKDLGPALDLLDEVRFIESRLMLFPIQPVNITKEREAIQKKLDMLEKVARLLKKGEYYHFMVLVP